MLRNRCNANITVRVGLLLAQLILMVLAANPLAAGSIFDEDFTLPPASPSNPANSQVPPPPATGPVSPTSGPTEVARREIPSKEDRARSRLLLKDVYGKELADHSIPARKALADKLLQQAAKSSNAPSDEFVLLSGAILASQEAADLSRVFAAADAMGREFQIEVSAVKAQSMLKLSPRLYSANRAENQRMGLALLEELDRVGDYSQAERVGAVLQQNALIASDRAVIQERVKCIHDKHLASVHAEQALAILKTSPNDPASNLAAGEYVCLVQGDWNRGLPMLAKGSDAALKALALKDLATSRVAGSGQLNSRDAETAGNVWWDASDHQATPLWKSSMHDRAAFWYRQAIDGLAGLEKIKIAKRIATLAAPDSKPTNTANAPEMDTIITELSTRYPDAIKSPGALELLRFHDGNVLHGNYSDADHEGSYSGSPRIAIAGSNVPMMTSSEPLPAGRYIVVFRLRAATLRAPLAGNNVCVLEVTRDNGNSLAADHVRASELRPEQWSSIPLGLELKEDDSVAFRFLANNHTISVDRIYIFKLKTD